MDKKERIKQIYSLSIEKIKSPISKLPFNKMAKKVPALAKFADYANYTVCIFFIWFLIVMPLLLTHSNGKSQSYSNKSSTVEKEFSISTIPEWMCNCYILNSDVGWMDDKGRVIKQLFSEPIENTKIKNIIVKNNRVRIESETTDGSGNIVFCLIVEFECHKVNNAGTCYTSFLQFDVPLTFTSKTIECSGPSDGQNYGQCLGILYELCNGRMFNDTAR